MKKRLLIIAFLILFVVLVGFLIATNINSNTKYSYISSLYNDNYEIKKAFVDVFTNNEPIQIDDDTYISLEEKQDLKYCYLEFFDDYLPVLLVYYPSAGHSTGEYNVFVYKNNHVQRIYGNDNFEKIYPEAGIIVAHHYGGGYGTLDTFYAYLTSNLEMIHCGRSSVMQNKENAQNWLNDFGTPFEDGYYLRNLNSEDKVSKKVFNKTIRELTEGGPVIKDIKWTDISQISKILN